MNYILRTVFNKGPTAPGGVWAPGGRFGQGGEDTSGGNHMVHTPVDPVLEYEGGAYKFHGVNKGYERRS
jgi:hypothetical protein